MKTISLTFLIIATLLSVSPAQDSQWLILNDKGKSGYSGTTNAYANPITTQFTLLGVTSPNRGSDPRARNDIFAIFTDGSHLNSRYDADPGFFYNINDFAAGNTSHNFTRTLSPGVRYMYLTNRYEGDDLPKNVKVTTGMTVGVPNTYILDVSTPGLITANHNVVFAKDITVIVDYLGLEPNEQNSKGVQIKFDAVERISDGQFFNANYLDLKPVFGSLTNLSAAIYPNQSGVTQAEEVTLSPSPNNEKYRYINFAPNNSLTNYGPDVNGNARFNAIFSLYNNGGYVTRLPEKIMFSHDPNFLQVLSICPLGDGSHIITYHLEFENTSDQPEPTLSAEVTFPAGFDLSCLHHKNWNVGGTDCSGKISGSTSDPQTYTFTFIGNNPLIKCTKAEPIQGKGYVEFKVRVLNTIDVRDLNVSLRLNTPLVHFGPMSFPIHDFRDLSQCRTENEKEKPVDPYKPFHFGHKKPNVKTDTLPEKNTSNKVNNNNPNQDLSKEPSYSDNKLICYRPLSSGKCECKNKPVLPTWLYAVAALAILSLLYLLLKRKKITPPSSTTP